MDKNTSSAEQGRVRTANADKSALANPARRRFGQAGLGASGILLTLACKPVLGAVAASPSGFHSANQSTHGHHNARLFNTALRPESWLAQDRGTWPVPANTPFSQLFGALPGTALGDATIEQVLHGHTEDPQQLAKYLTAAMLNARAGRAPFFEEARVLEMYNEWRMKGYYNPVAEVQWYAGDMLTYLQATQG
jgi:hypothetical protein